MSPRPRPSHSRSRAGGPLPAPHDAYVPAVEVTRGPIVESVHSAAIAVADAGGRIVARLGGVDHLVFPRSSLKPIQAMSVVQSGAVERFGLTPREIAVMAGSHSGEAAHVETVAGILSKIGLDESALQCGTHTPFSRAVAEARREAGLEFTPLMHNCSGKHAGMLAAALAGGHDTRSYLEPSHPVQQRTLGILADLSGRMRDRIAVGVDGCSAPALGVTLAEAARVFARLVDPAALPERHAAAAGQVVDAMRAHPLMVAGEGMLDSEVTAHPRDHLVGKRGAEGVQCLAFLRGGSGHGVAAKIADGDNGRARIALTLEILGQLELMSRAELSRIAESSALAVKSNRGRDVGRVRAAFTLTRE